MEAKHGNDINSSCDPSKDTVDAVKLRVGLGGLGVVVCLVGLTVILCLRAYKTFLQRLVLYLNIAGIFHSVSSVLQVVSIVLNKSSNQYDGVCATVGFFQMYMVWVIELLVFFMSLHLFLLAVSDRQRKGIKGNLEPSTIAISILLPLAISSVPLITHTYSSSVAWCWIKESGDIDKNKTGLKEQITLWFVPSILLTTADYCMNATTLCIVFRQRKKARVPLRHKQALKDTLPLLLYPVLLQILTCVGMVNRILLDKCKYHKNDTLWWISAVIVPLRSIVIVLTFVFHTTVLRWRRRKRTESYVDTSFHVPNEFSSESMEESLVIRGERPLYGTFFQSAFAATNS